MKKKIYKANGRTFTSLDEVQYYAEQNGFYISDTDTFVYKGLTIVTCNLKSK